MSERVSERATSVIARAWRTPLGSTIDTAMARLFAGERAALPDPRGAYGFPAIAPIRQEPARSRHGRFLRRMGLLGFEVATEALAASGVDGGPRVGLFSGVGGLRAHWDDMLPAFAHQRDDGESMWDRGLVHVHPYWMLRHLSNNVHALASAELDVRGEGATFGGGNGGAQALAAASRALRAHAIDAALVVAYDSLLEPETLVELAAKGALDFVPGEAAAAVVLVREADAPTLAVREGAGLGAAARCGAALGSVDLDGTATIAAAMGQLGAATALVQAIALAEMLRAQPSLHAAVALHASAPGLASAVRVEVPR